MDFMYFFHQYDNIAMRRWQNSAVGAATLPRGVLFTSFHFSAHNFRLLYKDCQILATKIQIIMEYNA